MFQYFILSHSVLGALKINYETVTFDDPEGLTIFLTELLT